VIQGSPPPVTGGSWKIWAESLIAYLSRIRGRLVWQLGGESAKDNGLLMWDEANGYPVVSKDGVWQPIILGDSPLDYAVKIGEDEIERLYGDEVSVLAAAETLAKYGSDTALGTSITTIATETCSSSEYLLLTGVEASVNPSVAALVDFEVQTRPAAGSWTTVNQFTLSAGGVHSAKYEFHPYLIVRKSYEVRVAATSTVANADVSVLLQGYYAAVQ